MTTIDENEELATVDGGYIPGPHCLPMPLPHPFPGPYLGVIGGGPIVCLDGPNVY